MRMGQTFVAHEIASNVREVVATDCTYTAMVCEWRPILPSKGKKNSHVLDVLRNLYV